MSCSCTAQPSVPRYSDVWRCRLVRPQVCTKHLTWCDHCPTAGEHRDPKAVLLSPLGVCQ